jgi:DNA-binding transcriptional ArsR family regulator
VALAQIFKALGDPVRLELVKRLSDGSSYTIGNLSKDLGISRQGARKQIQVLVSANIVQLRPEGREMKVSIDTSSLALARAFIAKLEQQWDERLVALKAFAEQKD